MSTPERRVALVDFTTTVLTLGITAVVVGVGVVFAYAIWRGAMRR